MKQTLRKNSALGQKMHLVVLDNIFMSGDMLNSPSFCILIDMTTHVPQWFTALAYGQIPPNPMVSSDGETCMCPRMREINRSKVLET
jgi:hypothetical protein